MVGDNSVLKQFPAEMAQMMAQRQAMQAGGIQSGGQGGIRPAQGANPPSGQPNAEGQAANPRGGQGRGMGMRGGGSIDDMLERFPNITIAI